MSNPEDTVVDSHYQYYVGRWCVFDPERAGDYNLLAVFICFIAMGLYLSLLYLTWVKQR